MVRELLGIHDEKEYGWQFELSPKNPDYLIITEHFYSSKQNNKLVKQYLKKYPVAIRIFRTGECVSPDFNIFDYAIAFDRDLANGDRVVRIPFNRYFRESIIIKQEEIDYDKKLENGLSFCNFMYSNANAHPNRDRIFYALSEYKKVDSLGRHLNNTGVKSTRFSQDWRKGSIELRKPYKFSIAAENASFRGYVSEKLVSCMQAGTIAIYWGDPSVSEDFNTKAFINCHEYNSFEEIMDHIKEIDNNDELWLEIAKKPWQTPEQIQKMKSDDEAYIRFLTSLFEQTPSEARRRPEGTFPNTYANWVNNNNNILTRINQILELSKKVIIRIVRG